MTAPQGGMRGIYTVRNLAKICNMTPRAMSANLEKYTGPMQREDDVILLRAAELSTLKATLEAARQGGTRATTGKHGNKAKRTQAKRTQPQRAKARRNPKPKGKGGPGIIVPFAPRAATPDGEIRDSELQATSQPDTGIEGKDGAGFDSAG